MNNILSFVLLSCTFFFAFSQSPLISEEYGKASYYADKLHGGNTAFSEQYDKNALTCAHKTLPHNTIVRVTRMDNGKSVELRVNDRGPFVEGRIVDVSKRAAVILDMVNDGVVDVKLEVLNLNGTTEVNKPIVEASIPNTTAQEKPKAVPAKATPAKQESKPSANAAPKPQIELIMGTDNTAVKPATYQQTAQPKPETAKKAKQLQEFGTYQIQVTETVSGAFAIQLEVLTSAEKVFSELAKAQTNFPGKTILRVEPTTENTANYKIMAGPFATKAAANEFKKDAEAKGYKGCFTIQL